jgi:N-methylhydantoinase A
MYHGHVDRTFELAIAIAPDAPDFVARLARGFHQSHREAYGYDLPDQPIQSVYIGATALVSSPPVVVRPYEGEDGVDPGSATRRVLAAPGTWVEATVVRRDRLPVGQRVTGPAIIEEPDSTTYIPPGFAASVHPTWCLIVEPEPSEARA